MKTFVEYQTQRLSIQPLTLDDASHILALNLDPDWQQFIGDCGVDDLENAKGYIINGPLRMYRDNGFGVLAVRETATGAFIGTCGLLQREKLANPDIGFAFLPVGRGKGYALEACQFLLRDVKHSQQWQHVNALVTPTNHASIKLLGKLGFNYVKSLPDFDEDKDTHLYRLNF
jgi:RimJ/RimL family protein N-acetyltransferase